MPLAISEIGSTTNNAGSWNGSDLITVTLPLLDGTAAGDILLLYANPNLDGVSDTKGHTWRTQFGDAWGAVRYVKVVTPLTTADSLTLSYASSLPPSGLPIHFAAGAVLLKITGVTAGALDGSDPITNYADFHDAGAAYEPATSGPLSASPFGTGIPSYQYRNDVPAGKEEVSILVYRMECGAPGSPVTPSPSPCPVTDFPSSPGGFTAHTSVTGQRWFIQFGVGETWQNTYQYLFSRVLTADETTVTDALSWGTATFQRAVFWHTLFFIPKGEETGPWNLETTFGQYDIAYAESGHVKYRRSDFTVPPFATLVTLPGGGADSAFRMEEESFPAARRRGVWVRSGAVVTAYTDDDGNTWSSPVTLWANAKHPTIAHDFRSGITFFGAWVSGHLEGRIVEPGTLTPGTAFTLRLSSGAAIAVDDATFHVTPAWDDVGRWLLVVRDGGAIKNFYSVDDGATWSAV